MSLGLTRSTVERTTQCKELPKNVTLEIHYQHAFSIPGLSLIVNVLAADMFNSVSCILELPCTGDSISMYSHEH